MPFGRYISHHLLVVDEGADDDAGPVGSAESCQHPVIATAAAAQASPVTGHRGCRDENHVGREGCDDAQPGGRLEDSVRPGAQGFPAVERAPAEVAVRQLDRQEDTASAASQRVQRGSRVGLGVSGDVGGHGSRLGVGDHPKYKLGDRETHPSSFC